MEPLINEPLYYNEVLGITKDILRLNNSTLFSAFSLTHSNEIGHRQCRPINECSKEEKGGIGWGKKEINDTEQNWMIGEREIANSRNYHELHFTLQHFARSTERHCLNCPISF